MWKKFYLKRLQLTLHQYYNFSLSNINVILHVIYNSYSYHVNYNIDVVCYCYFVFTGVESSRGWVPRTVLGLPERDDGLFNIPPHFPPFLVFSAAVVSVVLRKRSRSMRKLPWQELLTINYSSRYPLASPFLGALRRYSCKWRWSPRAPRTPRAGTRHLLTVTQGSRGTRNDEKRSVRVPIPGGEGEARIAANLHFIARARDRLPTPSRSDLYSFSYLLALPTRRSSDINGVLAKPSLSFEQRENGPRSSGCRLL